MITKTTRSGRIVRMANLRTFQFDHATGFLNALRKTFSIVILLSGIGTTAIAQVRLVADLNPEKKDPVETKLFSQNENDGGRAFFIGGNNQLWTSDGTTAGTKFLKSFREIRELEVIGDICYFSAGTTGHGIELWKSNGTAAGTVRVKDIVPGYGNSTPLFLTRVNNTLYFSANDVVNGRELWKSDGTEAGTQLVRDIYDGPVGSQAASLLAQGNRIFFVATTEGPGYELWVSDGTSGGTQLVKDINPGGDGSDIMDLTASDGEVYFSAQSPMRGRQLWKSDGTESGTSIVKVINTTGSAEVSDLVNVDGLIFFRATDGVHGPELFRSDGTAAGTFMLKDINRLLTGFSAIDDKLFFITYQDEWSLTDRNIWMSDGTPGGTVQLSSPGLYVDISDKFNEIDGAAFIIGLNRSADQSGIYRFDQEGNFSFIDQASWTDNPQTNFVRMGDLHFFPYDGYYWRSDGTSTGTYPLRMLCCGAGSRPLYLEDAGGKLYFSTVNGEDFWRTQGTAETTELLEDDFVEEIEGLNGDVFYRLGDSFGPGSSVWKLDDETGIKTQMSTVATDPRYIRAASDRVYFVANTPSGVRRMWVSDGTPEGTHAIETAPTPNYLAPLGSRIIFNSNGDLWVSDGTEAGTFFLKQLLNIQYLAEINGELLFYASDPAYGLELWKTDGTPTGTAMVKDIRQDDTAGYALRDLADNPVVVDDWLYFSAINDDGLESVWRSNGTATGTTEVISFNPYTQGLPSLVAGESKLFIITGDASGSQIWVAEGTDVTQVKKVNVSFTNIRASKGDVMYIVTRSDDGQNESIWRSDGTASGTYQIHFQGRPELLETSGDYVYLAGRADKEGSELFVIEESATVSSTNAPMLVEVSNAKMREDVVTSFPSPFTNGFTVRVATEENSSFQLEVFSLDGKRIKQAELASNTPHHIPAHAWQNGVYLMKIQTSKGGIITRKVVKNER